MFCYDAKCVVMPIQNHLIFLRTKFVFAGWFSSVSILPIYFLLMFLVRTFVRVGGRVVARTLTSVGAQALNWDWPSCDKIRVAVTSDISARRSTIVPARSSVSFCTSSFSLISWRACAECVFVISSQRQNWCAGSSLRCALKGILASSVYILLPSSARDFRVTWLRFVCLLRAIKRSVNNLVETSKCYLP